MSDPTTAAIDPLARHLAQLLSVADLAGRLAPTSDEGLIARDLASLARRAAGADRASLFQIDNADADAADPLWVVRLARDVATPDDVDPAAAFYPAHSALLLSVMQAGAVESLGPLPGDEPFYAHHRALEPLVARHVALAPVEVDGTAVGVLEIARAEDRPFRGEELSGLEAAARAVGAAVYGTRRERSIQAMLAAILPELLDPTRAPTSLPERLREWLSSRRMPPAERQAIAVATTIAELSASPVALELVQSVLSAARKAFVGREPGGLRSAGATR